MKHSALRITCLLFAAGSRIAYAAPPAEPIRENERKQVQLQSETRQLVGALDAMLGEYERNHLAGEDVATVRRVRQSLDTLTTAEMRQVVDLLQKARAGADAGIAVKLAADAFSAQKLVIVAIEKILAEHLREQEAAEIARQLNDLADRQARNLQNGIELGRMTSGTKPENFEALYQAQLETQRGEQAAIAAELSIARRKLEAFAANPDNVEVATPFKKGAQQLTQIEPVAAGAAESLKAGQLFKAATDEKTSREELRKVARQIAPRDRGPEALRKAEQQLAQLVEDQKQLSADTARQRTNPDFDKWLEAALAAKDTNGALPSKFRNQPAPALRQNKELRARFENEQREKAAQLAKLEDQQGELVAKTDALGENVAQVPKAADGLRQAMDKMQEARAAMQDANAPQAVKQQDAALAQLEAAHADIKRRADEAELLARESGDNGNNGESAKDLEQLRQLAEELAKQEAALAKNPAPDAAAQADLARRANQLAQRTPAAAPSAAPPAQAAAADARKAEQAMEAGKAAEGQAAAKQAAQNLAEAARQIGEEHAKAQAQATSGQPAKADDAAKMAQAAEDLAKAQQQIQQAQDNLRGAAENGGQQAEEKMQQAAQQLAKAAQQAAQAAAEHGAQMPPGAQDAATKGSRQAADAAAQAGAGENSSAQKSAQAASQSLSQAQGAMAAKMAGISPAQGGAPMPAGQGQGQAQGKGPGQGNPGAGKTPGQGKGSGPSSQAGNQPSDGATGYKPGDPQAVQRGARGAALAGADFIGLPQREREAIRQSLREKYPEEYGALVEQYLLNLATESAKKQQR